MRPAPFNMISHCNGLFVAISETLAARLTSLIFAALLLAPLAALHAAVIRETLIPGCRSFRGPLQQGHPRLAPGHTDALNL